MWPKRHNRLNNGNGDALPPRPNLDRAPPCPDGWNKAAPAAARHLRPGLRSLRSPAAAGAIGGPVGLAPWRAQSLPPQAGARARRRWRVARATRRNWTNDVA